MTSGEFQFVVDDSGNEGRKLPGDKPRTLQRPNSMLVLS